MYRLRTRLVTRDVRPVFAALASRAVDEAAFAAAQRRFVSRITEPLVDTLRAAQERGDLDTALDLELEATILAGPILHEHLLMHNDIGDRLINSVVSRWLATRGVD